MDLSNVRIREHFGLVSNNTHTGQFCFLISPPKNRSSLEKHDYILVDHPLFGEACQVLAVVSEITSYEEVAGGSSVGDKMGKMLATAEIVGYIDLRSENRPLREVLVPPNSGCRVYVPLKKFLEDVLNRNAIGEVFKLPLQIGILEASSAEESGDNGRVKGLLDGQEFIQKHTIITAVAGAGKTYFAKLLIQQMSDKISAQIILFDPYNEYSNVLNAIAKTIEIKAKMDEDALVKEIKKSQITILNGYGLTQEEKRFFYLDALQTLLRLRLEDKIKPIFLIIEEAENLKGESLDQIVVQGRKTGVYLCIITTHPAELGGKILSHMGNQIIGKTTNKEDVDLLANMAGNENALPDLALGEWIVNGITAYRPMKVLVNRSQSNNDQNVGKQIA